MVDNDLVNDVMQAQDRSDMAQEGAEMQQDAADYTTDMQAGLVQDVMQEAELQQQEGQQIQQEMAQEQDHGR